MSESPQLPNLSPEQIRRLLTLNRAWKHLLDGPAMDAAADAIIDLAQDFLGLIQQSPNVKRERRILAITLATAAVAAARQAAIIHTKEVQ
jgi:hypothetical protein